MKILMILAVLAVFVLILKAFASTNKAKDDTSRPPSDTKPNTPVVNDKLIVVSDVSIDDLKQALTQFCNMYNKKNYAALPRLTTLSSTSFAVTFPYDTDFVTFCFAVNYLKYPADIKWQAKVFAWLTTKEGDDWITDKSKNKQVMLFLADDDKEYDNVFMTTEDNIGYKLGFAMGEEKQLLEAPKEPYISPAVEYRSLTDLPFLDIE